ncbi:MAG TPA: hypothetical protein VMS00_09595 [Acidimicrobiales bacterium]|nr:hypothetical protein [Acidimicrobiales bacterium]
MPNSNGGRAPAVNAPDLSPEALLYIEKVRQTTKRLSAREPAPEDLSGAVQAVRNVATFDVEVPVTSRRRELELVKTGVKRLSLWYMRYLAEQLNAFGKSVADLGDALAKRTDALVSVSDELSVRLGALEERLKRLERVPTVAETEPAPTKPAPARAARTPGRRPRGSRNNE